LGEAFLFPPAATSALSAGSIRIAFEPADIAGGTSVAA